MSHPIQRAALDAGFLDARAATAHPFEFWRGRLAALPLGKSLSLEHRPEALCGWATGETTVWSALFAAPTFEPWPEGYGEICNYYMRTQEARTAAGAWAAAVRGMGFEVVAEPRLPNRAAAIRAGLGVPGLFGPLITPRHGSFVSLSALLVRTPPSEGTPGPERDTSPGCERCGICRGACPTGAISEDGVDALKCLRYDMGDPERTPEAHRELMGRRIMGCDECQRACPRNRGIARTVPGGRQIAPFRLDDLLTNPDMEAISSLIGANYARKGRIQTQAALAAANTKRTDLVPALERLLENGYAPLRRAARWALNQLRRAPLRGDPTHPNEP